jgi:hypothetical protein
MARPTAVGNGGTSPQVFNLAERAADPAAKVLGLSDRDARKLAEVQDPDKIRRALEVAGDSYNKYDLLRNVSLPRKNPSPTGRYAQQQALMFAETASSFEALEQRLRDAGLPNSIVSERLSAAKFYNPVKLDSYYFEDEEGNLEWNPRYEEPQESVALTDFPTSSSNYRRPRTVAAGWDPDTNTLTVVFRDGTFWNYYEVPEPVWIKFHFAFSKGPHLNRASKGQAMDGDLLSYANGPADMSRLSEKLKFTLVKAARTAQILDRHGKRLVNTETNTAGKPLSSSYGNQYKTRGTGGSQGNQGLQRRSNLTAAANAKTTAQMQARLNRSASKPTPRNTSALRKK